MSETAYATNEAAMLEPLAIEPMQYGAFSYVVGASETKWCMNAWNTRLGSGGRFEVRDPRHPLPLRNVTMTGLGATSTGVFIDPARASYTDPKATVFDRMATIPTLDTKYTAFVANDDYQLLIPGPYGSVITGISFFEAAWLVGRGPQGANAGGWNLWNEIGDAAADHMRVGHRMWLPVSKNILTAISRGAEATAGAGLGGVTWVNLPSTWGKVADPNTYSFRDDFMGASLDTTTKWTRTVSTAGNIEIDPTMAITRLTGNGTWGANGIFSQASVARASGLKFEADVYIDPASGVAANLIVGFHDGAGHSYTDFAHGVYFTNSTTARMQIFENGTSRGVVGPDPGWAPGKLYRVRITLGASGAATYEMQGGTEYPAIGGTTWTNITPATTSSATTPLHAGASPLATYSHYLSDPKIYS